jgi:hypothetical protein
MLRAALQATTAPTREPFAATPAPPFGSARVWCSLPECAQYLPTSSAPCSARREAGSGRSPLLDTGRAFRAASLLRTAAPW